MLKQQYSTMYKLYINHLKEHCKSSHFTITQRFLDIFFYFSRSPLSFVFQFFTNIRYSELHWQLVITDTEYSILYCEQCT